jgi:hypothetical protein
MKKYIAELVGTFFLVFFGVGTAVVAGDKVGIVGIAFAFGLGLVAAAYGIGPISGCHINPAVSIGVWVAGRLKTIDLIGYWVGQFAGATLAALVIYLIASGVGGGYNIATSGLGQNGFGPGYQGGYSLAAMGSHKAQPGDPLLSTHQQSRVPRRSFAFFLAKGGKPQSSTSPLSTHQQKPKMPHPRGELPIFPARVGWLVLGQRLTFP